MTCTTSMVSNELHNITDVRRTVASVDEMHHQTQLEMDPWLNWNQCSCINSINMMMQITDGSVGWKSIKTCLYYFSNDVFANSFVGNIQATILGKWLVLEETKWTCLYLYWRRRSAFFSQCAMGWVFCSLLDPERLSQVFSIKSLPVVMNSWDHRSGLVHFCYRWIFLNVNSLSVLMCRKSVNQSKILKYA